MDSAVKEPTEKDSKSTQTQRSGKYLTFCIGKEGYGISVIKVQEIIQMQKITPLPRMPEHIKGIINLRGKIIPVIELKKKFNMHQDSAESATCIVVVEVKDKEDAIHQVGITVDGVDEVAHIPETHIENAPEIGSSLHTSSYITGMAKVKGEVKTLLDIDKLITSDIDCVEQESPSTELSNS